MNRYDIYWAEVRFQDIDGEKIRPALVFSTTKDTVTAFKITSQGKDWRHQFEIKEWREAGLSKPSYICYEPIITLSRNQVGQEIGKLTIGDRMRFELSLMNRYPIK